MKTSENERFISMCKIYDKVTPDKINFNNSLASPILYAYMSSFEL